MLPARPPGIAALLGLGLLLLATGALGGCGEDETGAQPTRSTATSAAGEIELKIAHDDGAGQRTLGELSCRDGAARATGELFGGKDPTRLCAQARALRKLLTTQPDEDRMCTQIYGGPETAHVTGAIDGTPVDRRFARTNGCDVADFNEAAGLLQP